MRLKHFPFENFMLPVCREHKVSLPFAHLSSEEEHLLVCAVITTYQQWA